MMSLKKRKLLSLLPELNKEAKHFSNKAAKQRFFKLRFIVSHSATVKEACARVGVSEDWFQKWSSRVLAAGSLSGLKDASRAPLKQRRLSQVWVNRIVMIRRAQPYLGAERIARKLFRLFKKRLSVSTVSKVLKREGLTRLKKQRLNKRHMKRYRRPFPGYLQMDFKYVPFLIDGKQYYQLSCIDHHSSWRMIRVFADKSMKSVKCFLDELITECPFAIIQLQTDNDTAFTHKFTRLKWPGRELPVHDLQLWCNEYGVEHRLIPVGEKELNGKVENSHKWDDREFYSQVSARDYYELDQEILKYERNWNLHRETKALGWKTPEQVLDIACVRAYLFLSLFAPAKGAIKKARKSKKPKKLTQLDRYLNWMEKDAKKYGS